AVASALAGVLGANAMNL
ncbi:MULTISPECIES: smalltalk protein, partial [Bacteroides]